MENGYNKQMGAFILIYEQNDILDSAVLIAPLVFFVAPNDPRFTSTLEWILKPLEKGGLTSTGLVYRYDWLKGDDSMAFILRRHTMKLTTCQALEAEKALSRCALSGSSRP